MPDVLIAGGGIGGLTLALALHARKAASRIRVFEAAPAIRPIGVGINLRPHAVREFASLGLLNELSRRAVVHETHAFYTHNGQLIYNQSAGLAAGFNFPHITIHRADLQNVLLAAVEQRLGKQCISLDHKCESVEQNTREAVANFVASDQTRLPSQRADIIVGCDGLHSAVRHCFYPNEGPPIRHGISTWRGLTRRAPILDGKTTIRIGGLYTTGKMIIYPLRNDIDGKGTQLVCWGCEVATDLHIPTGWDKKGKLEDFFHVFEGWRFDWLDCAKLIEILIISFRFQWWTGIQLANGRSAVLRCWGMLRTQCFRAVQMVRHKQS